ncbi:MAG TPA: hypothetical protein VGK25_14375 [Ignavibacteria bacterium]
MKYSKMVKYLISIVLSIAIYSCGKMQNSPVDSVTIFIKAAEEHDITKAWSTLSPEAQSYYNDIGEKNRKSGKGILEHDISEVVKFRNKTDYKITADSSNPNIVLIIVNGGSAVFRIETVAENNDYKLKDGNSVRNALNSVAADMVRKDYY